MTNQKGRSIVEMLGVLAVMGVLSVTGIWAYAKAIDSHKANRILNDLNARIHDCSAQMVMMNKDECQLSSFPDKMDNTYSTSVQKIDNDFFKVIISDVPQKICQQILNKGIPSASHINLTSCNETNRFELIFHKNLDSSIFRKKCTTDADCDVCGSCDSDGYCLGECSLPIPDSEGNCGENECIVYDEESKTCRDACERVEYLESSGTQYIDTGVYFTDVSHTYRWEVVAQAINSGYTSGYNWFTGYNQNGVNSCGTYNDNVGYTFYPAGTYYQDSVVVSTPSGGDKYAIVRNVITLKNKICDYPLVLFARMVSSSNTIDAGGAKKIFTAKYYDDDALVRDFTPVISPDGEPCMFDKVSKKLFCNAGSGTFKTNKD